MKSLTSLFSRKDTQPMAGVDISTTSIKLVELSQSRSGEYTLECCAIEPLERGWIEDSNIENFDAVVAAFRRVVKSSGTSTKRVAIALPMSVVSTKKIQLPSGFTELEMEAQVEAEASQYIPFPLEEVRLDFCVMGSASEGEGGDVDVLLAAARKDKVEDRQALAEDAGLSVGVIDVNMFAARLAAMHAINHLKLGSKSVVAVFQIGGSSTTVQVLCNGDAVYERELGFGGDQLTDSMSRQYGFTLQEAETKKRLGDLPQDFGTTLVPEFVDNVSGEVARALQLFLTSTVYGRVDHILLAGGSSVVPGLDVQISRQSGYPTSVLDPFEGMKMGRNVRQRRLDQEAPSYLTACGLAMRRFQE
ncbi:MAG: pilus assembly protein PilM [Saezia sp.]